MLEPWPRLVTEKAGIALPGSMHCLDHFGLLLRIKIWPGQFRVVFKEQNATLSFQMKSGDYDVH